MTYPELIHKMWLITKLLDTKANHNIQAFIRFRLRDVINHEITWYESKSQQDSVSIPITSDVINHEITWYESKSQHKIRYPPFAVDVINHEITWYESKSQRWFG